MTLFPYRRLAYHRDGTIVFAATIPGGPPVDVAPESVTAMNEVSGPTAYLLNPQNSVLLVFPVPMRIRGVYTAVRQRYTIAVDPYTFGGGVPIYAIMHMEHSVEESDVLTGVWVDDGLVPQTPFLVGNPNEPTGGQVAVQTTYFPKEFPDEQGPSPLTHKWFDGPVNISTGRQDPYLGPIHHTEVYEPGVGGVAPYDLRQVTAIRFSISSWVMPPDWYAYGGPEYPGGSYVNFYLYGEPELGAWRDYLQIQDGEHGDNALASQMNWGDIPWHSSADKSVRVKNLSPDHEAVDVDIYFDPGDAVVPAESYDMFVMSFDRTSWTNRLKMPSLSPGATSPLIWIRRVTTERAALGEGQALLRTDVGEWQ